MAQAYRDYFQCGVEVLPPTVLRSVGSVVEVVQRVDTCTRVSGKVMDGAGGWDVSEVGDRDGLSQPQKTGCTSRQRNKCIVLCGGFFHEGKVIEPEPQPS